MHSNGRDMLSLGIVGTAYGTFTTGLYRSVALFNSIPLMVGLFHTAVDTYCNTISLRNQLVPYYLLSAIGTYVLTVTARREGVLHFL